MLDVPYLPQSELLCGGAAAAMVLRYWGMAGVRADDFAGLVSEARGGMRADDLAARIRELGWDVFPFPGRFEEVRRHLRLGRPVISLIEVGGGRFHYVVLAGEAGDSLVLHDPAATPYRLVGRAELERAWEATNGLSLLIVPSPDVARNVRPPAGSARAAEASRPEPREPAIAVECRAVLDRALAAAAAGRLPEADRLLNDETCRDEPAFLRELAGVRLRSGRSGEAIGLARRALERTPEDAHAARTLATALYVSDEPDAALEAWNAIDEPTVDLVRIAGLRRTSHRPVARLLGVRGGDLLTRRALGLARRHLAQLPAAGLSRVEYVPTGGGRADVVASLAERQGLTGSPVPLAATAVRAAIHRELAATAVSPLGHGETWTAAWRWWEHRPAVSFVLAAPAEFGPPAVWRLDAAWERESYAPGRGSPEERSGAALSSSGWVLPDVRTGLRLGFDRWEATGAHLRGGVTAEARVAGDLLRLLVDADRWISLDDGPGFGAATARLEATSGPEPWGLVLYGRAFVRTAAAGAPRTLWPGAGTGIARPDLLRAHPLLDDGSIAGPAFDRHLAGGGVELVHWLAPHPALRVGPAAFLDAARSWGEFESTSLVDAGLGVRLATAGGGPVLRIDLAAGLSDDEWAVSAGWSAGGP